MDKIERRDVYRTIKKIVINTWRYEKYKLYHFGGDPSHGIPCQWGINTMSRHGGSIQPYRKEGVVLAFHSIESAYDFLVKLANDHLSKPIKIDEYKIKSRDQILREILI